MTTPGWSRTARWRSGRGALACVLGVLVIGSPVRAARADLFGTARSQTPIVLGQADASGVTVRGGLGLQIPGLDTTLLQAQANVGGTCGAFDFAASVQQAFDEIPALFEQLGYALLANMPQLILCYASPTLCDLYKHFQALVNATIQARYAQCQDIQTAMAAAGLQLRGGQAAQCLETEQAQGTTLSVAMDRCLGSVSQLRAPSGSQTRQVELVKDTLEAAGATAATVNLARSLLGEVTLTAGGRTLGTDHNRPSEGVHQRYETFRAEATTALRQLVAQAAAGQPLSATAYQQLSLPGQPLPRAVLDALAVLQTEPVRAEPLLGKLAAGLALTRLTWEIHEVQAQLDGAQHVNPHLTPEERQMLRERLQTLQRELGRVQQEKEIAERHLLPAMEAVLAEYAAVQAQAARLGLRAPAAPGPPPTPFQGQLPVGYGH